MPLLALAMLVVLFVIALIPISIVQRFRAGTARRPARRWVATLNLVVVAFSLCVFIGGAAVTGLWVPEALRYTLAGIGVGGVLGAVGVALTRWEMVNGRWLYTPSRLLVLAITVVVAGRVFYGFWRMWEAWRASVDSMTWIAASGLAASMSAGAVVLGYYLIFWAGVRYRISRST